MEYEKFFDMSDSRTSEIIITYRNISNVYARIKSALDRPVETTSAFGDTTTLVISPDFRSSSTMSIRF